MYFFFNIKIVFLFILLQQYKPGFMLASLVCYGIEAVVCIIVLFYMRVKVLYLTITSLAFVCLFILAVLSYIFVKQSISHIPGSLTTERLSNPIYDVSNGHIETIMIKTITWYSQLLHHLSSCLTFWITIDQGMNFAGDLAVMAIQHTYCFVLTHLRYKINF